MKKFILMAIVAATTAIYQPAQAQVSLQINIGSQPNWGPRGYNYVNYYYLPEVESYYHVPSREFVYLERNKWVHRRSLPARYRNYNLHQGRKVVINQARPYLQHKVYQSNYSRSNVRYIGSKRDDHRSSKKYYSHNKRDKHQKGRY